MRSGEIIRQDATRNIRGEDIQFQRFQPAPIRVIGVTLDARSASSSSSIEIEAGGSDAIRFKPPVAPASARSTGNQNRPAPIYNVGSDITEVKNPKQTAKEFYTGGK